MNEIKGAGWDNLTQDKVVKIGTGKIYGLVANSHSSGKFKLYDGIDAVLSVKATAVLTRGGAFTPAIFAESTVTASTIVDGDTLTADTTVYRFKTTPAQAFDVALGANDASALDNLKLAINASGVGDGTDYFAGTTAHPTVIATTNTDTTQKVVARLIGTASNTEATTTTGGTLTWADTTLGGGTGTSVAGVATADSTFILGSQTYYLTNQLSETVTGTAIANEILWVTSDAVTLDNVKSAINGTGTEGTDYSTGTNAHSSIIATTNIDTAQTFEARYWGTRGNALVSTETGTNMSFASTTFTGGIDGARLMIAEYTLATGSQVITFPEPLNFVNGCYLVISSGTANLSLVLN